MIREQRKNPVAPGSVSIGYYEKQRLHDLGEVSRFGSIQYGDHEGYVPLKEAIAAKYSVTAEQVVTAQGTSMANFLAMAAVIERGDEVLIEQPAYEPMLAAAI